MASLSASPRRSKAVSRRQSLGGKFRAWGLGHRVWARGIKIRRNLHGRLGLGVAGSGFQVEVVDLWIKLFTT